MGVVLPSGVWPGKDEAMRLSGHDFKVIERPVLADPGAGLPKIDMPGYKALFTDKGLSLSVVKASYGVIQNDVPYELIEAVAQEGVRWHCGLSLEGGRYGLVGYLPEDWTAPGDDSPTLPFMTALWGHDGLTSLSLIRTAIRVVCANTYRAAMAEAGKSGLKVTIRHTVNWRDGVDKARDILKGARQDFNAYKELASELAAIPMDNKRVDAFLSAFLPMPDLSKVQYSDRVENNVNTARNKVRDILGGLTTAEAHRNTAYGVWQAGLEYLQHHRQTRSRYSKLNRCILSEDKAAMGLDKLVREVALA